MSYRGKSPDLIRTRYIAQSTQPSNPIEGDVYYDNGTNREEGLYQYKGTAWVLVGAGTNSQIKQYITNGDAETNVTTGWATYADAAGTQPVDGTGGFANVTISVSATTPMRDLYSFLLVKDAANRQGQGWSYNFSIDRADRDKALNISFDYLVDSGTFVAGTDSTDSDVTVWIYDVTNATLITPTNVKLFSNSSSVAGNFAAQFQTSATSTSYRLILHVGSTSASAYTLKADSVKVYPTQYTKNTNSSKEQTFTANGTFVVPNNVTNVCVELWAGGGGGGGSNSGAANAGGGGGGGSSKNLIETIPVTPGESISVVIGAGGAGGAVGANGSSGGDTYVARGSAVLAQADGGLGGAVSVTTTGGGGASAGYGNFFIRFSGGAGGNSAAGGSPGSTSQVRGAAGGAAGGTAGNGGGGGGGAGGYGAGGAGGLGAQLGGAPATPGSDAAANTGGGGGGGGGRANASSFGGGSGGSGIAIFKWIED